MRSLLSRKKTEIEREERKENPPEKKLLPSTSNSKFEKRSSLDDERANFYSSPVLSREEAKTLAKYTFQISPGGKVANGLFSTLVVNTLESLGLTLTRATGPWEWRRERQRWGCFSSPSEAVNPSGGESAELRANNWPVGARLLRACPRHWLSKTKVRKCLTSSVVGSVGSVDRSVGSIRFDSIRFGSVRHTAPHRYCRDEFCTSEYITPNVCRPIMTILFHLIRPRPLVLFPLLFLSTLRSTFVPRSISLFLLLLVVCSSTAFRFVALSLSLSPTLSPVRRRVPCAGCGTNPGQMDRDRRW